MGQPPSPPPHGTPHPFPGPPGQGAPPGPPGAPPPGPGGIGPPPPPGPHRRRRGLFLGGIGVGLLTLVSTVVVVVSLSGNNGPYASLPDCDTLLPREVLDAIPGTDGERAEGEYRGPDDLDDASRPLENGPLGRLSCGADIRDGADALLVTVSIFEPHADDPEAADELTGFLADRSRERTEIWEEEAFDQLLDRPVGGWREIGVGEFGFVGLLDDTDRGSSSQVVVVEYVTDNLWVRTLYRTEDPQDEAESYRYAERFAQRLDRRIAREAEPAG